MNTPPKKNTQNRTPVSKSSLEDSPVFNYLNTLSPLMPVRSILNPHPFSSENIASPSPVFTTPHLDREWASRFVRNHNSTSDPTNAVESTSSTEMELPQGIRYDCSGTNLDTYVASPRGTRAGIQTMQPDSNNAPESSDAIPYEDASLFHRGVRRRFLDFEMLENKQTLNENNTAVSESSPRLFLPGTGLHLNPIVMSSKEKRIKLIPPTGESCKRCNCKISKCLKLYCECFSALVYCTETCSCVDCFNKPIHEDILLATRKQIESQNPLGFAPKISRSSDSALETGGVSLLHSGIKRRCLDFEIPGNNQMLSESSSKCVLPSSGLHLNGMAMSSKDRKTYVIHDYLRSGMMQVGLQGSISTLQETLDQIEDKTPEDANQDVSFEPALQELNLSSPKKKRTKLKSCKRCKCKKSKCLKLYCECFAAGFYCIEPCSCVDCFNKPIHEDTVLATRKQIESRDPLAFAPRVIRCFDGDLETGDDSNKTPASARHKRGCSCKKSNCLKNYCQCYEGEAGCSINCRCEECQNIFGRKDGPSIV